MALVDYAREVGVVRVMLGVNVDAYFSMVGMVEEKLLEFFFWPRRLSPTIFTT